MSPSKGSENTATLPDMPARRPEIIGYSGEMGRAGKVMGQRWAKRV